MQYIALSANIRFAVNIINTDEHPSLLVQSISDSEKQLYNVVNIIKYVAFVTDGTNK